MPQITRVYSYVQKTENNDEIIQFAHGLLLQFSAVDQLSALLSVLQTLCCDVHEYDEYIGQTYVFCMYCHWLKIMQNEK